jgi:hypothetical protein
VFFFFWENLFPLRLVSEFQSSLKILQNRELALSGGHSGVWHQNCSLALAERREGLKNAVDNGSGFVVFIGGWVSAATAAGGQIADQESEIRVFRKGDRL